MKKSIIHIQSGNEDSGGIANYISLLVNSKKLDSFQNIVLVKSKNNLLKKKYCAAKLVLFNNNITLINFFKRIFYLREISLKFNNPLFHSHALKSGILAAFLRLLFNKKYVHTNHGLRFTQKRRYLFLVFLFIEILVIFLSERYICIRKVDYNFLTSIIKFKFISNKIEIIKLHLDKNFDYKVNYFNKFRKPFNFLAIGSLIEIKNPKKFVDFINFLVNLDIPVKGVWLGGGPLLNQMLKLTKNLNLDIDWRGEVNKKKVYSYLNNATYLVQTSKFEVYPTVVLESLSCGTPIITSKYWGVNELIKDKKNGIILDKKILNFEKSKIIDLFFNKVSYEKMSNFCKIDFKKNHCNHNNTSIKYKRIYKKIFKI